MISTQAQYRSLPRQLLPLAGLLALLLAACGGSAPPATTDPELEAAVESSATFEASGVAEESLCDNPYYPVETGATYNYSASSNLDDSYSYTTTISAVRPDGFTLTYNFDEVTMVQEWTCLEEGLQAVTFGGGPAGAVTLEGAQAEYQTNNVTGVSLPASISAGDTWTQTLDVTGQQSFEGMEGGTVAGSVVINFEAVGEESVETPAGTFTAMRVDVTTQFNFDVTVADISTPVEYSGSSTTWFAQDVGWVKSQDVSEVMGFTSETSVDLDSYNLP